MLSVMGIRLAVGFMAFCSVFLLGAPGALLEAAETNQVPPGWEAFNSAEVDYVTRVSPDGKYQGLFNPNTGHWVYGQGQSLIPGITPVPIPLPSVESLNPTGYILKKLAENLRADCKVDLSGSSGRVSHHEVNQYHVEIWGFLSHIKVKRGDETVVDRDFESYFYPSLDSRAEFFERAYGQVEWGVQGADLSPNAPAPCL